MNIQGLPAIVKRHLSAAQMTENYLAARKALAECVRVDEVQDFASKAEGAAVYAKQIQDNSLMELAKRIKVRAERRLGELLAEMTLHQRKAVKTINQPRRSTYLRVAKVPEPEFEAAVQQSPVPSAHTVAYRYEREHGLLREQKYARPAKTAEDMRVDKFCELESSIAAWISDFEKDHLEIGECVLGSERPTDSIRIAKTLRVLAKHLIDTATKFEARAKAQEQLK